MVYHGRIVRTYARGGVERRPNGARVITLAARAAARRQRLQGRRPA